MTGAGAMAPRIDHYDWAGGREAMLRFGPQGGTTLLVALPLMEEANRTRALTVATLRMLAAQGIGGALPELPATGESALPTEAMRLPDLRAAFAAAGAHVGGEVATVTVRSGALLIGASAAPVWMLSPQTGVEVAREWRRLSAAGDGATVAGNRIAAELWAEIEAAQPPAGRVVRLAGDPRPADRVLAAPPPWRRAEPDADLALAERLAADIADWLARCRG